MSNSQRMELPNNFYAEFSLKNDVHYWKLIKKYMGHAGKDKKTPKEQENKRFYPLFSQLLDVVIDASPKDAKNLKEAIQTIEDCKKKILETVANEGMKMLFILNQKSSELDKKLEAIDKKLERIE